MLNCKNMELLSASLDESQRRLDACRTLQSLSQRSGTPTLANATVSNNLRFGGQSGSSDHRFMGVLDDVQVFDGTVTAAHVAELFTAANPCAALSVRLLAPSQNASYNAPAMIEFWGTATTTAHNISQVDLYDGATLVTTQPFGFNSATFGYTAAGIVAGTHAFTLRATDSAAQTVVSSPVTVTVYQVTGTSTTTVTVPDAGATLYTSDPIHLAATATPGNSYSIYLVRFYADGVLIGEQFNAPYLFTWKFPTAGTYSIVAEVIDNSGHSSFSAPITITVVEGAPQVVYYYNDVAGTPLAATDQQGTLLWDETYAPYGERYTHDDTSTQNGLWYTGKPTEDVTGLAYYGGRWYSPSIGRFYGVDPQRFNENKSVSFNRYAYANNNPYRYFDPDGRDGEPINGEAGEIAAEVRSSSRAEVYRGFADWMAGPVTDFVTDAYTEVAAWLATGIGLKAAGAAVGVITKTVGKDLTYLYQKVGPSGEHLKFGITKTPGSRYTEEELAGGRLKILAEGSRKDILQLERNLHETLPIGREEGQGFYVQKQIDKGLTPPPYGP